MQTAPFESSYHSLPHQGSGVYGSVPGFDSSTGLKFPHSGYTHDCTSEGTMCYPNYVNTGVVVTQGYSPREPPTYAESTIPSSSTLFHPGFVTSSSPGYYKLSGNGYRQMEMNSEYNGYVRNADNFLLKADPSINNGPGPVFYDYGESRYTEEEVHNHHHHHQTHLQHQYHQQQQQVHSSIKRRALVGDISENAGCKTESSSQRLEFKSDADLSIHVQVTNDKSLVNVQNPSETTPDNPPGHHHGQSPEAGEESSQSSAIGSQLHETGSTPLAGSETQLPPAGENDQGKSSSSEVKPTLSYIALIAKSILESPQRRLNLGSIYGWIEKNFPYYKNRGQGWRNSVRHNLSLNDCFIKAGRCEDGKGNYWAIHPANMQDFMRGDFRQRRRSRRRGRKKDCELNMYCNQFANGFLGAATSGTATAAAVAVAGSALGTQMSFTPSAAALSTIYSPYTDAERRAYRLDEALLRQSMNNPFFKWYHQPTAYPNTSSPPSACNSTVYSGVGGMAGVGGSTSQWPQNYAENGTQAVYSLNSSFSRNYSTPAIV